MAQATLPIQPEEATKALLKKLPSRRMKDVLEKRFGLKGKKMTLEAIGRDYRITRERVRQIEADALKHVGQDQNLVELQPLFRAVEEHLKHHGEMMAERELLTTLAGSRGQHHLIMLLGVGRTLHKLSEDEKYYDRWATNKDAALKAEEVVSCAVRALEEDGRPVVREVLDAAFEKNAQAVLGTVPPRHVLNTYLASSKLIRQNPYGDYGLVHWPMISPRGVKDKAYGVLSKSGKPLHFTEVASAINRAGWSKRKAHPQTVHNELIKDPRFVLVGRGLYALKEWGFEPGVVRDVIVSVLKRADAPLTKDEIIKLVSEKRFVKPPTILLNLQNKSLFRRTEDGRYTVV